MANPYPLEAELRKRLCAALENMGLSPDKIPQHGVLELREQPASPSSDNQPNDTTWIIEFDEFVRDENGYLVINHQNDEPEMVRRRVRLPKHPREYGWPM